MALEQRDLVLADPRPLLGVGDAQALGRGEAPHGELQDRLSSLLGDPSVPIAGPAMARNQVEAVLVIGDAFEGSVRETVADLEQLLDALGAAYERFARGG